MTTPQDRCRKNHRLVVDVMMVVDIALENVHRPRSTESPRDRTRRMREQERFLGIVHQPLELDGEVGHLTVVLSRHIGDTARRVLVREGLGSGKAADVLGSVVKHLLGDNGIFDSTDEDYPLLDRRCWYRCGTSTEDEAVLACAERHNAAIVTRDAAFRTYLVADRHRAAWLVGNFNDKFEKLIRPD